MMTPKTNKTSMGYIGINCDQCGKFVGKDGYISTDVLESTNATIIDYALCAKCKREQEVDIS